MKSVVLKAVYLALFLGVFFGVAVTSSFAQNTISGMVFGPDRKPVSDINVELLDRFERLVTSKQTRGSGFYSFRNLGQGVFYIQARVSGTNFKKNKVRLNLGALNSIGGVEAKQVDLFLEVDKGKLGNTPINNTVVFAQTIPEESKKSYESGVSNIGKKKLEKAAKDLEQAVTGFPDYYDALDRLGWVYLEQNRYPEAERTYKKAFDINPKSFTSVYGLAFAQNKLKKKNDALNNLKKANELDPASINARVFLGELQRELKQYVEAEESFLKAKAITKNKQPDVNWKLAELYYFNLKKPHEAADELDSYLKNLSKKEKRENQGKIVTVKKLIKKFRSEASKQSDAVQDSSGSILFVFFL